MKRARMCLVIFMLLFYNYFCQPQFGLEWNGALMAFFDLPLQELQHYLPERDEPADFDQFWLATLIEARSVKMVACFEPVSEPLHSADVFDVTFPGYGGQAIKGWLLLPKGARQPLPCLVEYVGYGGGRGRPLEHLEWVSSGFAHFIMDTRGQGSSWSQGETPDLDGEATGGQYPGFMTRGILDQHSYYYRRVYCDAVRAVEAVKTHPLVDSQRVALRGGSQGGGIAIAVAGLMADICVALVDVPFLCHMRRAVQLVNSHPYQEIVHYLRVHRQQEQRVFATLAYFDGVNFATRTSAQALFSTALMDETCPPSTVFAAYNNWAGEKDIKVYPYNEHDGGGVDQLYRQIELLQKLWQ